VKKREAKRKKEKLSEKKKSKNRKNKALGVKISTLKALVKRI